MNVREELQDRGCLYLDTGNQFIGVSGKHLSGYCNIDPALTDVRFVSELSRKLVEPWAEEDVEVVFSAAVGGIPLAHWGAEHLMRMSNRTVAGAWADKIGNGNLAVTRNGFRKAMVGQRTLYLEDMINQMHTINKLIHVGEEIGALTVGAGCIASNSGVTAEAIHVPKFNSLCDVVYDAWTPEECVRSGPCSEGWPIVVDEALGHGAEYQEQHPDYGRYVRLLDAA